SSTSASISVRAPPGRWPPARKCRSPSSPHPATARTESTGPRASDGPIVIASTRIAATLAARAAGDGCDEPASDSFRSGNGPDRPFRTVLACPAFRARDLDRPQGGALMNRLAAGIRVGSGLGLLLAVLSLVGALPATANPSGTGLVISQVYGGGGNSNA